MVKKRIPSKKIYFVLYMIQSNRRHAVIIENRDIFFSLINPNKKKHGMI